MKIPHADDDAIAGLRRTLILKNLNISFAFSSFPLNIDSI